MLRGTRRVLRLPRQWGTRGQMFAAQARPTLCKFDASCLRKRCLVYVSPLMSSCALGPSLRLHGGVPQRVLTKLGKSRGVPCARALRMDQSSFISTAGQVFRYHARPEEVGGYQSGATLLSARSHAAQIMAEPRTSSPKRRPHRQRSTIRPRSIDWSSPNVETSGKTYYPKSEN